MMMRRRRSVIEGVKDERYFGKTRNHFGEPKSNRGLFHITVAWLSQSITIRGILPVKLTVQLNR